MGYVEQDDRTDSQSYWAAVLNIAEEAATMPEDERNEWIWETVDSSEWIIYTWRNKALLGWSPNESYAAENWGAESLIRDGQIHWAGIAFGAMYADVLEAMP